MNNAFMNMVNSVDDIIKRKRYLKDLQKVIPYCKQCLLENEVPYVNSILDNPPFIIDTVRNNSISYIMEPCDSNYKKIKFYYALISGLVEVDRLGYASRLNSEYIRGTVHYNTIYNTLVELQESPEEFKKIPIYTLVLLDYIRLFKEREIYSVIGVNFYKISHQFKINIDSVKNDNPLFLICKTLE